MSWGILQYRERMPTKEAIKLFTEYSRRFALTTQRQYRGILQRFLDGAPDFVDEIRAEHIERFIMSLSFSNNSKNTVLVPIKSLFTYLEKYYGLPNVAAKVKNFPSQPFRQRVISAAELSKILAVATEKESCVIRWIANTGLRAQEFCDLVPGNISPGQKFVKIIGKRRKMRTVPLNNTCRKCIPDIFYKRFTRHSLAGMCAKLARKAGIPHFGPHALRHYFVTELVKRGVPIAIVSKIVGHVSPEMTYKIYTHLLPIDYLGITDVLDF